MSHVTPSLAVAGMQRVAGDVERSAMSLLCDLQIHKQVGGSNPNSKCVTYCSVLGQDNEPHFNVARSALHDSSPPLVHPCVIIRGLCKSFLGAMKVLEGAM